uniref:C-type lectin domain-containing protein n=1 Tax=Chelonoidis abingdonii TaxID=106734 RepID=A0A8C0GD17_CHEAB
NTRDSVCLSLFLHSLLDSPSPLWRLFAVIFGILCLALLVTSGLLGALGNVFYPEKYNSNHPTPKSLSDSLYIYFLVKDTKCIICPKNWIQHGKDCYELSSGIKSWSVCKEYCSSLGSRLLKIDSKEEFLSAQVVLACIHTKESTC